VADPSTYRPAPGTIPTRPGVYRFRDADDRVIYVGKAINLRSRLSNYFQNVSRLHPRTAKMVTTAARVDWTVVETEVEALTLEYTWIKEFEPRFNVKFRDDASYPYLCVTMSDEIPRVLVTRGKHRKGDRYFGPYTKAWAIRDTVDRLLRVFPIRSCTKGVLRAAQQSGRPCLMGFIDKCAAPCVGRISIEDHRALAEDFCDFMAGSTGKFTRRIEQAMRDAAARQDYEAAARYRDDLKALEKVMERNAVVFSDATDADVIALAVDELEASVQVFHVRGGRIRGQRGWVAEILDESDAPDLIQRVLLRLYEQEQPPREILVPELPADLGTLRELWPARTEVRVPQRGDKKDLLATVKENAEQGLALHKLRRGGDLTRRSRALEDLQEALDLPAAPLRIESFDISHTMGTNVVASQVVFEDGLPKKSDYRRYRITGAAARDDTASMRDVLTRRLRHHLEERDRTRDLDDPDERRFAYPPSLLLVDGGPPQVAAAQEVLDELGITDIALAGLAKRLEEVWLPGEAFPVVLPRTSESLFLLQRVRDEAHRFAISYHRSKRGRSVQESALDGVPGLGAARRRALLETFTTVAAIRDADDDQLLAVPGIGPALVAALREHLAGEEPGPAVDMATGEIIG
jgi:excinuclease ABC subunit C